MIKKNINKMLDLNKNKLKKQAVGGSHVTHTF